jgi:multidrug transporter EmrE-like cation transporter
VYANLIIKFEINRIGGLNLDTFSDAGQSIGRLCSTPVGISGVISMFIGASAWMLTISRMEVSTSFPLSMTLNTLMITLGGIFFLSEALTLNKVIGCVLILGSIYFLSK